MLNRVQFRLVVLLVVVVGAILAGLVLLQQGEQRRMHQFYLSRVEEENATLDKLLELKGASLEMFAYDYTYWDEMVRAIAAADDRWADENVAEALGTYQSDAAWTFASDGRQVYSAHNEEKPNLAGFALPESALGSLSGGTRFAHFFVPSPAGLLEVRAATVHPSGDPDRTTEPQGVFAVGRLWDGPYLSELARLTGGQTQLARGTAAGSDPKAERAGALVVGRTLADWRGQPLASLESRTTSYAVLEHQRAARRMMAALILVSSLTIIAVLVGLLVMVTRPLNRLSRSLEAESPEAVLPLVRDRSEFGQLARLVVSFVRQKAELLREVAERKLAMEALAKKEAELERSNQELEQFAYVASHDLQEPLRMVGSYTQLLSRRYKGKLDADADEFIGFAVDGVSRMQRLINDLLQYSRVGTRGREPEPVESEQVLTRSLQNLKIAIEENKAAVTHDPLPRVMADDRQLEQLFQNLVGNALKFHGDEPPQVHIAAERSNGSWMFSVKDNGIGIEPQYADRIFLIFQRLHTRKEYPGTGIGLAVCKKIVERHGGRIWVESEAGRGAAFKFTLRRPAEPAEEGLAEPTKVEARS
jgi:signal transduction histidine kinase